MIERVLEQTGGHQQRAAAILGISRRTLSRKLKSYGLRTTEEHCA
jgi:DNA-binding protein Fis